MLSSMAVSSNLILHQAPQAQVRRLYMSGGLIVKRREEGTSEVWPYSSGPDGTSFTGKPPGARCFFAGKTRGIWFRTCQNHGKNDGKSQLWGKTTGKLRIYWDKYGENAFFGVFVMFLEVGTLPLAGFFG